MINRMPNRRTHLANLHIDKCHKHACVWMFLVHVHQALDQDLEPINKVTAIGVWSPDVFKLLQLICRKVLDWIGDDILSACALAKASVNNSQRVIEKKLMPTSKKRAEPLEPKRFSWPAHLPAPPPPPKLGGVHMLNLPPPPRPPENWK